jgi:O-antigen/teichoic acid export membrane protein
MPSTSLPRVHCSPSMPPGTPGLRGDKDPTDEARSAGNLILRNTLFLTAAQVLTVPLSILANALVAYYLGPEAFGYAYLASTLCAFGFLIVGWGHEAVLPAVIARERRLAGTMLASSIAWRVALSFVVYVALDAWSRFLNYPAEFHWVLGLMCGITSLTYLVAACKDTIRGLERTDIPAYAHVGQQLLATTLLAIVLILGGDLRATLVANVIAGAITLAAIWMAVRHVGVGSLTIQWVTIKRLCREGAPFLALALAMTLQPIVDALFLSKLAPVTVMGWYAVARRLVGALLLPASALVGALYPTLCRLYGMDKESFIATTKDALHTVSLLAVPVALSCALFPEVGVVLFSRDSFGPAEDNLRILAMVVFLIYFSMPLGACIMAAGRQRAWSLAQCACVLSSLVLDPLLVREFQTRSGNGGLGLGVAAVISEVGMIAFGVVIAPAGIFDRRFLRTLGLTFVAGLPMIAIGVSARSLSVFVSAPLSLAAYVIALWMTGALTGAQVAAIRVWLKQRLSPAVFRAAA